MSTSINDSGPPTPAGKSQSTFLSRSATDDAAQLARRHSVAPSPSTPADPITAGDAQLDPSSNRSTPAGTGDGSPSPWRSTGFLPRLFLSSRYRAGRHHRAASSPKSTRNWFGGRHASLADTKHPPHNGSRQKPGALPRPVGGTSKLGTFAGVFVPTTLNVISILMFLRFTFILGQSGLVGMLGMLITCYLIDLLTVMSVSAIATNGTVRGGGAYYLISRSLGPEFGGSIGIVFYIGCVFNTGMNAVGLVDCLVENFGTESGNLSNWLPEGFGWQYLWSTMVLIICASICMAGSGIFARCSNGLLVILLISTFSIPVSTLVVKPFHDLRRGIRYTGWSSETLLDNLMPRFTKGAAGSHVKRKEDYRDIFGILFPAAAGIFAGASMSGDLKHPSKAIPKGTLSGLALTFGAYLIVIISLAATVTRASLYQNTSVIHHVNVSSTLILLGEFATSFFSSLMGVIGASKLLQALARDDLIPGLSLFGQGTGSNDDPIYAIMLTFTVGQLTMLFDLNQIASLVTMTYLMTFLVTNLACFLLKISSAPNFRPRFRYFNWLTAATGTILSGAIMFFVDGRYASACIAILIIVFLLIHYTTPPKEWGDVSQSLIYHQVRKYLLRLRPEHVKFWRPQILLLVNDPRRQYRLIQFCNSLKKGSLFILGHVIIAKDFGAAVPEARRQQTAWTKYIDFSKIKAFPNITISQSLEWGARTIVLSSGLGGMRPNIAVMGLYNLNEFRRSKPLIDIPASPEIHPATGVQTAQPASEGQGRKRKGSAVDKLKGNLPTDEVKTETTTNVKKYMTVLEDLLLHLRINVAVAKGFQDLELPALKPSVIDQGLSFLHLWENEAIEENTRKYIDLWPIQMSAEMTDDKDAQNRNVVTTNFDTYTLILQLGCILNTVPSWKRTHTLRVAVFVEYESDIEEERGRVAALLWNLRIQAEVRVYWLASGNLKTYEVITNGKFDDIPDETISHIDDALKDDDWWQEIQRIRGRRSSVSASQELAQTPDLSADVADQPARRDRSRTDTRRFAMLRNLLRKSRRSTSVSGKIGIGVGMRTHRLPPDLVPDSGSSGSESEAVMSEDSESELDATSDDGLGNSDIFFGGKHASVTSTGGRGTPADSGVFASSGLARMDVSHSVVPSQTTAQHDSVEQGRDASLSDTALLGTSYGSLESGTLPGGAETTSSSIGSLGRATKRPTVPHQSSQKFSSKPVPRTTIVTEEGPGRSIMFTDTPSPVDSRQHSSIYKQQAKSAGNITSSGPSSDAPDGTRDGSSQPASGFPGQQAVPLSFNDLPCRAQHLILNELMTQESAETAVIFTTLPCPVEGTCKSESESVRYLSDLDILCGDLPPTMLVHSNSMTVTMNL